MDSEYQETQQVIKDAWLGLGDTSELKLDNPLIRDSEEDVEHPGLHEIRLMQNPDYLSFACKVLLNIELLPEQAAILEELWTRPFPMFVASRGFGKLLRPEEKLRIKNGWTTMADIKVGDKIYGSDGKLTNVVGKTSLQTNVNMYRITLRDGRTIECCEDHMWRIWDKNKNKNKKDLIWSNVTTKQMLKKYYWDRQGKKSNGKEYRYALPINECLIEDDEQQHEIHPYILGVLLGDGCLRKKDITITSNDRELVERFEKLLPYGYKLSKRGNITYAIVRIVNFVPAFWKLCNEIGILYCGSKDKFIPNKYKFDSYDNKLELIKGLMDTDGYSNGQSVIEYYTISHQLAEDYLDVARSLGLHCKDSIKQAWYKQKRYNDCHRITVYTNQPIFSLPRKLEYLQHVISKQGRSKYEKVFITNIEYIGKGDGYCIQVDNVNSTYLTKDYIVTHNSWLLAVYCMLKMALTPNARSGGAGVKIVIVGAAFRQSKVIFEYMETLWRNTPILRSICDHNSGPRRDVDRCTMRLNENWAIAVPLGDGSKIRGLRANIIVADEFGCLDKDTLVETDQGLVRIGDSDNININLYTGDSDKSWEKPSRYIKTPLTDVYEIKMSNGYIIRCSDIHRVMTQDGWKTPLELSDGDFIESENNYKFPTIATITKKDAWLLGMLVSEGSVVSRTTLSIKTTDVRVNNLLVTEYGFASYPRDAYQDKRGWNCKKSYELRLCSKKLRNKFYDYGLDYVAAIDKKIPKIILQQPRHIIMAFLEGLFEGDGSAFLFSDKWCDNRLGVAYYSVSETLCRDIQILLDKLGYDSYINNRDSKISNNLQWFIRLNGKHAYNFASQLNIDRFRHPVQNCFIPQDPSHITWDIHRNKWKISIVRLGKTIQKRYNSKQEAINAVAEIKSLPRFRKVISVTKLLKQQCLYDYYLPSTHSFYAGGSRQHNSIPPDIYETVVQGFAAVSADPVQNVKEYASRKMRKEMDMWSELDEDRFQQREGNQIIISGTADYDFKHYADYWKRYCGFVRSEGDPDKLKQYFDNEEGIPEHFNHKYYSVIRIPYKLIPKGFMDDKVVARAKATVHSGIYQMEYGACHLFNTIIITNHGLKYIQDIKKGDLVLTHKGRFRPVTKILYRLYTGKIYNYQTLGYNQPIRVTHEHPFWYGKDRFEPLKDQTCLANLNELYNIDEINLEEICTNYLETSDSYYIYPISSQSKIDVTTQQAIRNSKETQVALSNQYEIGQTAISYICNDKRKPKTSLKKRIPLDYHFGLIVGYYASEGSIGSNGRQVSFALNEHKDTEYQKQLLRAIQKVFGFHGKSYTKQKNTIEICINSRLVAEVMQYICPGLSHDKLIKHEIMFANEECLRGIIEGYWNGDGHINDYLASGHCVNSCLLNQIRLGLSYFNISSSINFAKDGTFYLNMSSDNLRNFLTEFYHIPNTKLERGFIHNTQGMSILPITDKTIEEVGGEIVYNLEVEEDNSYSTLNATTHNCFTADSDGFFKRSLIESCVATEQNVSSPHWPIWCPSVFDALTRGHPELQYVYGIDPASEQDNFSIVVLEVRQDHCRVVYCWTTNRDDFKKRQRAGLTQTADFYGFCAQKIRELMRIFPPATTHPLGAAIGMDAQGGGIAVMEALHDPDKYDIRHEKPIWPIIDPDKEADTDIEGGLHILQMVQFANAKWTGEANHGLRKDLEDKVLLFPRFDPVTLELAIADDKIRIDRFREKYGKELTIYDSLEDCVMEVEELKDELTTIVMTRTGTGVNGRDRWDTPEIKTPDGKKGRMRKDRYSSLVIANMLARQLHRAPSPMQYEVIGGFTTQIAGPTEGPLYKGPEWFTQGMNDFFK